VPKLGPYPDIMRTLWLVLAFLLAVGVPFLVFSSQVEVCTQVYSDLTTCGPQPSLGWPLSVAVSLIALVVAAFAVRMSVRASRS